MIDKYLRLFKTEVCVATITLLVILLTGCNRPLEAPEVIDPIYNDLLKEQKRIEKENAETTKILSDKLVALEKAPLRTILRTRIQKEINEARAKLVKLAEEERYFKLRIEKRKFLDRESYKRSLKANIPWPNPDDYEKYLASKRLRAAPRIWDARVPRSSERYAKKDLDNSK
jgi:hypothetical protein